MIYYVVGIGRLGDIVTPIFGTHSVKELVEFLKINKGGDGRIVKVLVCKITEEFQL